MFFTVCYPNEEEGVTPSTETARISETSEPSLLMIVFTASIGRIDLLLHNYIAETGILLWNALKDKINDNLIYNQNRFLYQIED